MIRTKMEEVEGENERLSDENKRLQLRSAKRLSLSGTESSYIERQVGTCMVDQNEGRKDGWMGDEGQDSEPYQ